MHAWFSALLSWYFAILGQFGIPGMVVMTALAVPSELVIPPAAYVEVYKESPNWGSAVLLSLLVIVAGAVGFTLSACLVYWVARGIGRPIIVAYGKYFSCRKRSSNWRNNGLHAMAPAASCSARCCREFVTWYASRRALWACAFATSP